MSTSALKRLELFFLLAHQSVLSSMNDKAQELANFTAALYQSLLGPITCQLAPTLVVKWHVGCCQERKRDNILFYLPVARAIHKNSHNVAGARSVVGTKNSDLFAILNGPKRATSWRLLFYRNHIAHNQSVHWVFLETFFALTASNGPLLVRRSSNGSRMKKSSILNHLFGRKHNQTRASRFGRKISSSSLRPYHGLFPAAFVFAILHLSVLVYESGAVILRLRQCSEKLAGNEETGT